MITREPTLERLGIAQGLLLTPFGLDESHLTRALAVEWGPCRIRANAVAVGLCESRMTVGTLSNPQYYEPTLARTPLGRTGTPEDVAGAVLFLSSAQASWITGARWNASATPLAATTHAANVPRSPQTHAGCRPVYDRYDRSCARQVFSAR